ncbi:myo-inosose-2 dehydratase [Asticcacaulis benevestitus]|uniref:Xylose isomerase-like TIM barrel domain-containing protein n=1 Tax=Asticcacaulis benevestitus DSM 16100 = ATCC BAA-896 TaxID=1121022 RepID=V4RKM9_9CAUL|nr:myo-inosose-2 dehydratase [Asticcacaulis benevestitus]ESQ91858.1 hypothetical protein ABENE_09500 [Asticcacaulis benevestitus DSM 16100 = ATCC BAA-896]
MTIRFGVSPIAWINDDMPELGAETSLQQVLQDAQAIGFVGIELGGRFPKAPESLKPLLDTYSLDLVGGWYSASLLTRTAQEEIEALKPHLALLKAMNCSVFIIAETSNAIHGQRETPLQVRPHLTEAEWRIFGQRLTEVADYIYAQGLKFAYHYHLGTVVQDNQDLAAFFAFTGPRVGITLDTGHAVLGGIDPFDVIDHHADRIQHVHAKDIRQSIFDETAGQSDSFLNGVLAGMFTVPGDGSIDFARLFSALANIGYDGWIIVEAEQDPKRADPRLYAQRGLDTLKHLSQVAGLSEVVLNP